MRALLIIFGWLSLMACGDTMDSQKKGFQVNEIVEDEDGNQVVGLQLDSLKLETRPGAVLLTAHANHRLVPVFKVNYDKKTSEPFTGSNSFRYNWYEENTFGNNWNDHVIPGFEVVYGYNMINMSHYNYAQKIENLLFESPILMGNFYYPSFTKDTLNGTLVVRDYYFATVYDEDTNKDGFVNSRDLKRFYHFDIEGSVKTQIIPNNYSVVGSDYDPGNDVMYVKARLDKNANGKSDSNEPFDIFWIDLKDPMNFGRQYTSF